MSGAIRANLRIFPVIMAGGASSRLWPASNREKPKWDLRLFGGRSLLQQAWARARTVAPAADCLVVAGAAQAALVRRSLPELPRRNLLVEPAPRDTAGAIALAAAAIQGRGRSKISGHRPRQPQGAEPVMLVLPGDHVIRPLSRFQACVAAGARAAADQHALVTFGIVPRRPATGYGYIHCGAEIGGRQSGQRRPRVLRVRGFREKPDLRTAKRYLSSGDYYWNGGIFLWTLAALREELARQLPGHADLVRALAAVPQIGRGGRKWTMLLRKMFPRLRKISIDYGILERARKMAAVAADFAWDDIGSWSAVGAHLERGSGNACAPGARGAGHRRARQRGFRAGPARRAGGSGRPGGGGQRRRHSRVPACL